MILIVCVDKENGMLFNNRRQSRDRKVIEDICKIVGKQKLHINEFSKDIFEDSIDLCIDKDIITTKYEENDYCFIEDIHPSQIEDKITKIIIYNWNRTYPADLHFDIDISKWKINEKIDIEGYSHEKITRCEYERWI